LDGHPLAYFERTNSTRLPLNADALFKSFAEVNGITIHYTLSKETVSAQLS
jgi:hypothetical protein